MRTDLYSLIHKSQRFHLFNLANEIGRANFDQAGEAERIAADLRKMIEHLRDHANNEETYIHPLFKEIGQSSLDDLETDHRELESELENLEVLLKEARWHDLYGEYSRFLGQYLVHLSDEETAQKEILWTQYDDQRLREVFNRFKSERPPQSSKADLELMLDALSIPELARIFLGMKTSAPAVFQGACGLAAGLLSPERWRALQEEIM